MGDAPWFRRRRVGVGWTPATWQGWAITLAAAAGVTGSLALLRHSEARIPIVVVIFAIYVGVVLVTGGARGRGDGTEEQSGSGRW
jgi:hypothetical protein